MVFVRNEIEPKTWTQTIRWSSRAHCNINYNLEIQILFPKIPLFFFFLSVNIYFIYLFIFHLLLPRRVAADKRHHSTPTCLYKLTTYKAPSSSFSLHFHSPFFSLFLCFDSSSSSSPFLCDNGCVTSTQGGQPLQAHRRKFIDCFLYASSSSL